MTCCIRLKNFPPTFHRHIQCAKLTSLCFLNTKFSMYFEMCSMWPCFCCFFKSLVFIGYNHTCVCSDRWSPCGLYATTCGVTRVLNFITWGHASDVCTNHNKLAQVGTCWHALGTGQHSTALHHLHLNFMILMKWIGCFLIQLFSDWCNCWILYLWVNFSCYALMLHMVNFSCY